MSKVELTKPYTTLPRGGYVVETSVGYIQFGSPPETIKDTMFLPRSTPQIFVLPNKCFHVTKGISVAELEFPLYYNHFFRQKKTYIVCTASQRDQLKVVLGESVFGPENLDLTSEYLEGENSQGFPNMKAELDYFRGGRDLDDLVHFVIFNKEDKVRINEVEISKSDDNFYLRDGKWNNSVSVPSEIGYNIVYDTGARLPEPYKPSLLGITCLGPSHGFDPDENTSGFILWINHQGIMIDPPVNSTEWLRNANVNPKLMNSIILTHCHADHDAGTFQKILEEGKVTIYTTETIIHSFIRKYHSLTEISIKELFTLFDFVPIIIGKTYHINGAEFRFSYALHSIPSLSFSFNFQDQSFLYSSDHLNDPDLYYEFYQKKVLTESRFQDLMNFSWHHKIIYHEAGVPPLHTRIDYLNSLPKEIQKKIHVYHISKKNMPEATDLTLCKFGIENTVYPEITPPHHEEAYRLLDALSHLDIFSEFPIGRAKDFLAIVEQETYKRGDVIIEKGTPGDKFFIILAGNVRVDISGEGLESENVLKRYGTYEYFGEASLINDTVRNADILAETDVNALTIEKSKFLNFIGGTDLQKQFQLLNHIRKTGTWEVLSNSRFFNGTTSAQKTQLELLMELKSFKQGENLITENQKFNEAFILKSGMVEVLKDGESLEFLNRGDFCGEIFQLQKGAPANYTFNAVSEVDAYRLDRSKLVKYIAKNPGVYMRLNYVYGK